MVKLGFKLHDLDKRNKVLVWSSLVSSYTTRFWYGQVGFLVTQTGQMKQGFGMVRLDFQLHELDKRNRFMYD